MKNLILFLCWLPLASPVLSQQIQPEDLENLTGTIWKGELMYLNYSDNKPVHIAVELVVSKKKKRKYAFAYTYPKEPQANRTPTIKISKNHKRISKNKIIERELQTDGILRVVTAGKGKDNGKAAVFRYIYLLGPSSLVIRKEVQYASERVYFVRNEYRFER